MEQNDPVIDPLSGLLEIIISKKLIIIIGFGIVFSLTVISSILLPDVYEAYTTIYVISPTLPKVEVPFMEEYSSRAFLINQKQLITSRIILEKVIKELKNYKYIKPDDYFIKFKKKLYSFFAISIESLETVDTLETTIERLKKKIRVRLPRGSNIVKISTISKNPQNAAFIANTLAKAYIEYSNNLFSSKAQNAYEFIQKQAESARQKYIVSENNLSFLKIKMMPFQITEEYFHMAEELEKLEREERDVQFKIDILLKEINQAKLNPNYNSSESKPYNSNESKPIGELQNDPEISVFIDQMEALKRELFEVRLLFTAAHPDVIRLKKKISEIEKKIYTKNYNAGKKIPNSVIIETDKENSDHHQKNFLKPLELELNKLQTRKNEISTQIEALLNKRKEIQTKQFLIEKLSRELENEQQTLSLLKTKLEEARILNANEKKGSIRVIDRAVPPLNPLTRKKIILLSIGAILGLIFGTGMAFIAEFFDDSIKEPDEAEDYLDVPVLGIIPKISPKTRRNL